MFKPDFKWHFAKSEPYKHYFTVFYNQIKNLSVTQEERIKELKLTIKEALSHFKAIEAKILLDDDSNGSHLPTWFNVINAYEKELNS
jgi:hypothetical protein